MLSTLIDMMEQLKSCSPLLRELSQDIHSQLGDIDQVRNPVFTDFYFTIKIVINF
jgi:hypothetical protein